jgi:hypothetical protein
MYIDAHTLPRPQLEQYPHLQFFSRIRTCSHVAILFESRPRRHYREIGRSTAQEYDVVVLQRSRVLVADMHLVTPRLQHGPKQVRVQDTHDQVPARGGRFQKHQVYKSSTPLALSLHAHTGTSFVLLHCQRLIS